MRKKIAALSMIIILMWSTVALAWLPAAYAVVTWLTYSAPAITAFILDSVSLHAAIGIAGLAIYYGKKENGKKTVNPDGSVNRESTVTWVELQDGNKLPVKQSDGITAKITYANFVNILTGPDGDKYPMLKAALDGKAGEITGSSKVGDVVDVPGIGTRRITSKADGPLNCLASLPTSNYWAYQANVWTWGGGQQCAAGAASAHIVSFQYEPTEDPVGDEKSFARNLANSQVDLTLPQDVYSDRYGQEIDDFIKDNPNVVSFVDPQTGKQAIPEGAATNAQVAGALAGQRTADATQETVDSAEGAAQRARAAATAARAASDGDPGNQGLRDAAERAERAADAAEREAAEARERQARAVEEAAKEAAEKEEEEGSFSAPDDNTYDPEIEEPEKKSLTGLLDTIFASSPLLSMIRGISVTGHNPQSSFSCNLWGQTVTFDFSQWASVLSGVGTALLGVCHLGAIYLVFRRDE